MARPREFDLDEALDAATQAFWDRGYEATSIADLIAATGLQKGSLYKAFGDKRSLFVQVLTRYMDQNLGQFRELLGAVNSPLEAIRGWFRAVVGLCHEQEICRGCFALNTLVELGPHDDEIGGLLRRQFQRVARVFAETIALGQELGEFRTDRPASELAEFVVVYGAGLVAASKSSPPRARTERLVALGLSTLTEEAA